MNHEIDPTPGQLPEPPEDPGALGPIGGSLPAAPPTRSWLARYRRLLIPAGGLVVVGAAAAAALVLVLTPRTSVEKMVPATVDVYAVAHIDRAVRRLSQDRGLRDRRPRRRHRELGGVDQGDHRRRPGSIGASYGFGGLQGNPRQAAVGPAGPALCQRPLDALPPEDAVDHPAGCQPGRHQRPWRC